MVQKLADAMQKHEHLLEESISQSKEIVLMKQGLEISQNATDGSTVEETSIRMNRMYGITFKY